MKQSELIETIDGLVEEAEGLWYSFEDNWQEMATNMEEGSDHFQTKVSLLSNARALAKHLDAIITEIEGADEVPF